MVFIHHICNSIGWHQKVYDRGNTLKSTFEILILQHRSDVWMFGCLLFEIINGFPPYPGLDTLEAAGFQLLLS